MKNGSKLSFFSEKYSTYPLEDYILQMENLFHSSPLMTLTSFSNLIHYGLIMALEKSFYFETLKMGKCNSPIH